MKKILIVFLCLFIIGCAKSEIKTSIEKENGLIAINYPVTGTNIVDNEISSYINKTYKQFKSNYKNISKPELNITYTYKKLNNDIINISLNTCIKAGNEINKIKTFTYDKKNKKFLTMEDIVDDLNAFDYDLKKQLLNKYRDSDMDYLNSVSYNFFTIDDENLTIYFNPAEIKSNKSELIYLDIPLNSLKLLIDIDKSKGNDNYLNLKKKNIDESAKVVALTFDDGPTKYTEKILKVLKDNNACATFFVIGNKVDFYDETLVKMLKNGNEIGNHSYSHKWLNRLSESEFKKEIDMTQKEIKKATGFTPTLFRPTYGGYSDKLKAYTDLTFVLWDVDSQDWKVKNSKQIIKNIVPNVKNGSIILMHDNHKYALDALDEIIKKLKEQDYEFVTVSELLELKKIRESE